MAAIKTIQVLSIGSALIASGGIATLTIFDVPQLQSQLASRSLPSIRWLFSRGSHIFPEAALVSGLGFLSLAYHALPTTSSDVFHQLFRSSTYQGKVLAYIVAAGLSMSIGPFTSIMVPNNFALIKLNEDHGGTRSEKSAATLGTRPGQRTMDEAVDGKGEASQLTDLSGPQGKTKEDTDEATDREVRERLQTFAKQNMVRALLLGGGGVVGLLTALA